MADNKQLANTRYKDWVKVGLALKYLREGILQLVDETVKRQHGNMLSDIKTQFGSTSCDKCSLKTLMPVHTKDQHGRCPLGQKFCNCLNPSQKKLCPTMFCSAMYDKIIAQHRYSSPNWKNTDIRHWQDNHWEIAKCNISDGYSSKQSAKDTDCSGLLQVVINDMEMHTMLDEIIDPPDDIFSKVRKVRDMVFHSADQELDETTTIEYIDAMIAILNDKKHLVKQEEAKKAKQKLIQLKKNNFVITTQDELDMRKEALEDISRMRQESLTAIESKQDEAISLLQTYEQNAIKEKLQEQQTRDRLKEEMDKFFQQRNNSTRDNTESKLKEIETKQSLLEKAVDSQRESLQTITDTLTELESEISEIKRSERLKTKHQERLDHLHRKALQDILLEIYEKYHTKTSVLPMLPEEQVDITEIYAEPYMYTGKYQVSSYRDLFYTEGKKNLKIYITGDAGMGKSTFCKQMIKKWCTVHSGTDTTDDLNSREENNDDLQILKNFEFLFFISLQHESGHFRIQDMIKNQLLEDEDEIAQQVVDELLLKESEKCLIILDGLDEWNPTMKVSHAFQNSNIPQIRARSKCTVLTTARPWKMTSALLTPADVDLRVKIDGIGPNNFDTVVKRVSDYLNEKYQRSRDYKEFIREVYWNNRLAGVRCIPIMLLQYICLWHEGRPLGNSLCDTYSDMVELFLQRCQVTIPLKQQHIPDPLPSCMKSKELCQKYKHLLLSLARLSFESLFQTDGQSHLSFDRQFAQNTGMENEDIDLCLRIGILTENKVVGKSAVQRLSSLSFVHKTFQEFFSALYLYNYAKFDEALKDTHSKESLQNRIVSTCSTVSKILEMGKIFIFISGMNPSFATWLSKHISDVANSNSDIKVHRSGLKYDRTVLHIQKLILDCIQDMENQQLLIPEAQMQLGDMEIDGISNEKYLSNIDTSNIKSLAYRKKISDQVFVHKIQVCKNLQKLSAINESFTLQKDEMTRHVLQLLLESKDTIESLVLGQFSPRLSSTEHLLYMQNTVSVLCQMNKLRALSLQNETLRHEDVESLFSYLLLHAKLEELSLTYLKCAKHFSNCSAELLLRANILQIIRLQSLDFDISFIDDPDQGTPKLKSISIERLKTTTEKTILESLLVITSKETQIKSLACSVGEDPSLGENQSQLGLCSVQALINFIPTQNCLNQLELSETNFKDEELNISSNKKLEYLRLISCPMSDLAIMSVMKSVEKFGHSVTVYFGKCKIFRKEQGDIIGTMIQNWKSRDRRMKVHHLVYHYRDQYIEGLFQWEPEHV